MNKLKFISFLIIISCSFSSGNGETEPFPDIKIPIHPNAFDVVKYSNEPKGTKSIYYKINIEFPAQDVILFYEEQLKRMEFIEYSEDSYGTRRWENFNAKTGNWEIVSTIPARYIATWIDKEKKIRIVLFMRYKFDALSENWGNRLLVNFSVSNFFDFHKNINNHK